jgi:hypothetical protein
MAGAACAKVRTAAALLPPIGDATQWNAASLA